VQDAFHSGAWFDAVFGILQMAILILPAVGIVATFWMAARRVTRSVWTRTEGRPAARMTATFFAAAAAGLLAYVWWPNGDYRPIQPGEKGTVQGAIQQVSQISTGRPALTKEREHQLRGAPGQSSQTDSTRPTNQPRTSTTQTQTTSTQSTPQETTNTPTTTTTETTTTTSTTTTNATTTAETTTAVTP
jgi:cytoskeletal protein RodZ